MDTIDIFLYIAYGLVLIAILGSLILPLIKSVGDAKSLIKTGAGIAILVVVFFIAYAISDNEVTNTYMKADVDAGVSKFIGGALITTYVFFVVAFLSIIVTEISKNFR